MISRMGGALIWVLVNVWQMPSAAKAQATECRARFDQNLTKLVGRGPDTHIVQWKT